jgi:CHAD domain-containing protein
MRMNACQVSTKSDQLHQLRVELQRTRTTLIRTRTPSRSFPESRASCRADLEDSGEPLW